MRKTQVGWMLVTGLLAATCYWYWQSLHDSVVAPPANGLAQAINQCDLIASKAAAELPEQLPFQQLEKAARQSRVLEHCMQDRGYQENPAWVTAATKQAAHIAAAQGVSENEAYETLRRKAMLQSGEPVSYWRKRS